MLENRSVNLWHLIGLCGYNIATFSESTFSCRPALLTVFWVEGKVNIEAILRSYVVSIIGVQYVIFTVRDFVLTYFTHI